jgi:lysophospholipase L1-like esterase
MSGFGGGFDRRGGARPPALARAPWVFFGWIVACGATPGAPAPVAPAVQPSAAPVAASPPRAAPAPSPSDASVAAQAAKGAPAEGAAEAKTPPSDPPVAAPPVPPGTVVLHIGDSFTQSGFAQALKPRFKAIGAKYEVRAEQSSFTTTWSNRLGRILTDTQPDLVIITLGANEVANVDPPAHAPAVRNIVRQIGNRPCVWVSPPLWAKETGIIDVLREHSAPCRFFDSDALVKQPIPRRSDKIHPSAEGGAIWAEAFWAWLQAERAPLGAVPASEPPATGKRSPWTLRLAPADEHVPHRAQAPGIVPAAPMQ